MRGRHRLGKYQDERRYCRDQTPRSSHDITPLLP
jgi:hypothetical protein